MKWSSATTKDLAKHWSFTIIRQISEVKWGSAYIWRTAFPQSKRLHRHWIYVSEMNSRRWSAPRSLRLSWATLFWPGSDPRANWLSSEKNLSHQAPPTSTSCCPFYFVERQTQRVSHFHKHTVVHLSRPSFRTIPTVHQILVSWSGHVDHLSPFYSVVLIWLKTTSLLRLSRSTYRLFKSIYHSLGLITHLHRSDRFH